MIRIIVFSTLLFYIGPVIRFRKHVLFYYFYIVFIASPILYLIRHVLSEWTLLDFPIITLVILFSYPYLKLKTKLILALPVIISIMHLVESSILSLISIEVIFLYFILDLVSLIYKELKTRHQLFIFQLLLVVEFILDGVKVFIYYEDIQLFLKLFFMFTTANILIAVLFTIAGPNFVFKKKSLKIQSVRVEERNFHLTIRELEILHLISIGMTSREIAEKLFISQRTVKNHRAHIKMKLNCKTRSEMTKIYNDKNSAIA